jgi:hypothetical protein
MGSAFSTKGRGIFIVFFIYHHLSLATNNSHRRAWGYLGYGILGFQGLVGLGTPLVLWFWAGLLWALVPLWMV